MKSKVIPFAHGRRSREELREQACAWLARLDMGATPEDLARLSDWLAEDPRHVRMLMSMAAMWDQSLVLSELSEIFPLEDKASGRRSLRRRLVAAALATVVLGGAGFFGLGLMRANDQSLLANQVHETAVGERRQVELPDGSEITLNTNTRLRVAFDDDERGLYLERGEGFFNVAHDTARPFRVYVGSRVIEAVGTAFTVLHTESQDLEILVSEGRVNYRELAAAAASAPAPVEADETPVPLAAPATAPSAPIPLEAGERMRVAQDEQIERVRLPPNEVEVQLAWRVGMLVFQGDTLETVLEEVSRYTNVRLEAEESIRSIPVDGVYRAGDIDALMVAMLRNFNIDSQRIGEDQILFVPRREE